jgi:uncharacterized protein YkwD
MSFESLKSQQLSRLGTLKDSSLSAQGFLDAKENVQLHKLKLTNRSRHNFQLQGLEQNANLKLLTHRGAILHKSKQAGLSDESISAELKEGTYYLKVRLNSEGSTNYTLTASPLISAERQQSAIAYTTGDGVNAEERKLYRLINNYRERHGLPSIRFSKALSAVANRHVVDLYENVGFGTHSWSDATYNASDPRTYGAMWEAPQRLNTGYPGNGYENLFGTRRRYTATAKDALSGWRNSQSHNDVMLNKGVWKRVTWKALGVGLYKGFAAIWFGEKVDPTGKPQNEP